MGQYRVNDAGDVCARLSGVEWEPFEPEQFGWASPGGRTTPDERRALDQLMALPSFEVLVAEGPRFVPGPRPARAVPWGSWNDGAASPAAAESKGGVDGTLAYSDRLTDALGLVAQRLPVKPERSPFIVHDFVGGRRIEVSFRPPPLGPGGRGPGVRAGRRLRVQDRAYHRSRPQRGSPVSRPATRGRPGQSPRSRLRRMQSKPTCTLRSAAGTCKGSGSAATRFVPRSRARAAGKGSCSVTSRRAPGPSPCTRGKTDRRDE